MHKIRIEITTTLIRICSMIPTRIFPCVFQFQFMHALLQHDLIFVKFFCVINSFLLLYKALLAKNQMNRTQFTFFYSIFFKDSNIYKKNKHKQLLIISCGWFFYQFNRIFYLVLNFEQFSFLLWLIITDSRFITR